MNHSFLRGYGFWHLGEGFQTILMMWYMTFHAALSPGEIGLYQSLQLIPFLIFTAIGGSLTDRVGARTSFAVATGLFALLLAGFGLSDALTGFSPVLFGGYCLLSGLLSAIANPAIDTFIPEATPRPAMENALLAATVHNIAKLSGNAATLLLPLLSALGGFVVNGLIMAASAACLLGVARAPHQPARHRTAGAGPARVLRHFRNHPESFDILLGSVMLGLFTIPGFYIFPPLVIRLHFVGQGHLLALTGMAGWIGAILAAGAMARAAPLLRHPGRFALAIWAATALLFLALLPLGKFWALLAVFFLLGGQSVGKALVYGFYLRDAPAGDRALLIGIDQTAFWGLATLGTLGLGQLIDHLGLATAILLNSGGILLCVAVLTLRGRLWRLGPG